MNNYIIHRDDKEVKIVNKGKEKEGYSISPRLKKHKEMLDVKNILVIDKDMQKTICDVKFDKVFKRLTKIVIDCMDGTDTSEGDTIIALNEIKRAKLVLLDEYTHYLSKQQVKKMLKKLELLEEEAENYLLQWRMHKQMEEYIYQDNSLTEKARGR